MYRFARTPKWILSHLFVLALVVSMIGLGLWQLNRLGQRQDRNAQIEAALDQPVRPWAEAVASPNPRYANVTVTGTFRAGTQALVGNRNFDGAPGFWVLDVLDSEAGPLAVLRGFVNRAQVQADAIAPVPNGSITVVGYVEVSVDGAAQQGDYLELNRPDIQAFGRAVDVALGDFYFVAATADDGLLAVERPPLSDGPHLAYAAQWFIFSAIAGLGYGLILRRQAQTAGAGPGPGDSLRQ